MFFFSIKLFYQILYTSWLLYFSFCIVWFTWFIWKYFLRPQSTFLIIYVISDNGKEFFKENLCIEILVAQLIIFLADSQDPPSPPKVNWEPFEKSELASVTYWIRSKLRNRSTVHILNVYNIHLLFTLWLLIDQHHKNNIIFKYFGWMIH